MLGLKNTNGLLLVQDGGVGLGPQDKKPKGCSASSPTNTALINTESRFICQINDSYKQLLMHRLCYLITNNSTEHKLKLSAHK